MAKKSPAKPKKKLQPEAPAHPSDKSMSRLAAEVEKSNPEFVEFLRTKGILRQASK